MAANAQVKLELVVDRAAFDAGLRASAQGFQAQMRTIDAAATAAGNDVGDVFAKAGIRSSAAIRAEMAQAVAAFDRLAASGRASGADLGRAFEATRVKIEQLKGELGGAGADQIGKPLRNLAHEAHGAGGSVGVLSGQISTAMRNVLAFAAAAAGLTGALAAIGSASQAARTVERFNSSLLAVTGSTDKAKAALGFVRREADALGLDLASTADGFVRLAASTQGTELAGKRTEAIFHAVAQASTVLGLSTEQTNNAINAIGQIASKGTVQMEELRGQLSEALPGAMQVAARAMGVTTGELAAMVEKGVDASEFLPKFAAELDRTFRGGAAEAAKGTTAEFNRLKTAVFEVAAAVGGSGLNAGLAEAASILREKLSDPRVVDALSRIGREIGNLAVFAANSIDSIGRLAALMGGAAAVGSLLLASRLAGVGTAARLAALEVAAARTAIAATGAATLEAADKAKNATPAFSKLSGVLGTLTRGTFYVTLAVAGYEAAKLATEWAVDHAERTRQLTAAEKARMDQLRAEIAARDEQAASLSRHAQAEVASAAQVGAMSRERLAQYRAELEARREYEAAEHGAALRVRELLDLQRKSMELNGASAAALAENAEAQKKAAAGAEQHRAKLADVVAGLNAAREAGTNAAAAADAGITPAAKRLADAFTKTAKESGDTGKAVSDLFERFNAASVASIETTVGAIDALSGTSVRTARALREGLVAELAKLSGTDLLAFQTAAGAAFASTEAGARQAGIALDASLRAAMQGLGLDTEAVRSGLSRAFTGAEQQFTVVATNIRATGADMAAAYEAALAKATNPREVRALEAAFRATGAAGKLSADQTAIAWDATQRRLDQVGRSALAVAQALTGVASANAAAAREESGLQVERARVQAAINELRAAEARHARDSTTESRAALEATRANLEATESEARAKERGAEASRAAASAVRLQAEAERAAAAAAADGSDASRAAAAAAQQKADAAALAAERLKATAISAQSTADGLRDAASAAKTLADSADRAKTSVAGIERAGGAEPGWSPAGGPGATRAAGVSEQLNQANLANIIAEQFGAAALNSGAAQQFARIQAQIDAIQSNADLANRYGRGMDDNMRTILSGLELQRGAALEAARAELAGNRTATRGAASVAPGAAVQTMPSAVQTIQLNGPGGASASVQADQANAATLLEVLRQAGLRAAPGG